MMLVLNRKPYIYSIWNGWCSRTRRWEDWLNW